VPAIGSPDSGSSIDWRRLKPLRITRDNIRNRSISDRILASAGSSQPSAINAPESESSEKQAEYIEHYSELPGIPAGSQLIRRDSNYSILRDRIIEKAELQLITTPYL
jgi:hypothetical protein